PSNAHTHYEISFRRLRSLGSTSAHLAYVARGVAMAAVTRPLYIWDIAATLPLFRAAEVGLVYLSGKHFNPQELLDGSRSKEPLLAAPLEIIELVRKMIKPK
ncbi:MAG: inositol monophosphatase, partial [Chloroflexi bacterium]|nr:inositol monophosphatase [Chloroflexota bacterium]